MAEGKQPIEEDFSKYTGDLAEHAIEVALEIYSGKLHKGSKKTLAFSPEI